MATTKPLSAAGSVVLGASGSGLVDLAVPTLQTWRITKVAVYVSSAVSEPQALVYVDTEAPGSLLAGTYSGSNDSSNENQLLMPGQRLLCRWTGGDSAATATLSIFGEVTS